MINIDLQRFSGCEVMPLLEGGKGVSISTGETCGAWAACGAIGTFSGVNADSFNENGNVVPQLYYGKTRSDRQREMIEYAVAGGIAQAKIARERSNGKGRIHMNVLWEMGACEEITDRILEGSSGCINGIICGAGMPYGMSDIASKHGVYYYPIVSSARAFSALFRRSFKKSQEFLGGIVYEDPWLAGGHNGLSNAESPECPYNPYLRLVEIRNVMNEFNLQHLPIIIAGGVWWLSEWEDYINNKELGAVGFQFGTRPILTKESPVANTLQKKLMSLKKGDIKLTQLSPTGFYSSAINNTMLSDLLDREKRQAKIVESSDIKIKLGVKEICLESERSEDVNKWISEGFSEPMMTPDNTIVFVTPEQKKSILSDQKDCCGCLSMCRFSSWSQSKGSTGKLPDPRSFCIQKTLQSTAHGGNIDNNLLFAGHLAYRFASDPFYSNNFIPTTKELIDRILTGY